MGRSRKPCRRCRRFSTSAESSFSYEAETHFVLMAARIYLDALPLPTRRRVCIAIPAVLIAAAWWTAAAVADVVETFDAGAPTWRLISADGTYHKLTHSRVAKALASGDASPAAASDHCESITVLAGSGSQILYGQPLPPAHIIDELAVRLDVWSDRPNVQLVGAVTFPHLRRPQTGAPVRTLVFGDRYGTAQQWQTLELRVSADALRDIERALRAEHGPHADLTEPMLDTIAVNLCTGAGKVTVRIDDLRLAGFVPAAPRNDSQTPAHVESAAESAVRPASHVAAPRVRLQQGRLEADDRPLFVRAIEHRGEPFAMLREIGFNTVLLTTPLTAAHNEEAARNGLWLIASSALPPDTPADRVLAVLNSAGATETETPSGAGGKVPRIHTRIYEKKAPHAALRDGILWLQGEPLGGNLAPAEYAERIRTARHAAITGSVWATVPTELPASVAAQAAAWGVSPTPTLQLDQIRTAAFSAIAAGATGLIFPSYTPLSAADAQGRCRMQTLEAVLRELTLAAPWVAADAPRRALETNQTGLRADVLTGDHSQLVIVWRADAVAAWAAGPTDHAPVRLKAAGIPESYQAFRISPAGIDALRRERMTGGLHVRLDEAGCVTLVLLSQDTAALKSVRHRERGRAAGYVDLLAEILVQESAAVAAAAAEGDGIAETIQAAELFQRGEAARGLGALQPAAHAFERSLHRLGMARRGLWLSTAAGPMSPTSNPLRCCFPTGPAAAQFAEQLSVARPGPNLLPEGDCESLERLQSLGWRNLRRPDAAAELSLHVLPGAGRDGSACLHLCRTAPPGTPSDFGEPALVVTTRSLDFRPGDVIRVSGWVQVRPSPGGPSPHIRVRDTLGGTALAARLGPTEQWRQFTLYRKATAHGPWLLDFSLTGAGEVLLDDVAVNVLR
jgi:hypothetical protein